MTLQAAIVSAFEQRYGSQPLVVRAPGRINLIGEHTDYNQGFVMPAAIDYATVFAVAASTGTSEIYSVKYQESYTINLQDIRPVEAPRWANYLLGVLRQFVDMGMPVKPFHCVFGGDIPMGAGLSSSASVECGFAYAINALHGFGLPKEKLITMAQWSEHHFVGVKCGIMDQFASMMGKAEHVIVLDCRSLDYEYSPLHLGDYQLVLCDSKVKHALVDSEYNTRRAECEQGVAILQQHYPAVQSLRDATEAMVEQHRAEMPGKVYQRCLYIVQEIRRVQEASQDLKQDRLEAFGKKMFETHDGLSKLYEVSCKELDFLADEARAFPGVAGARMMGGGFGGCTINLVKRDQLDHFRNTIAAAYRKQFGHDMEVYVVAVQDGTHQVKVSQPASA